MENIKSAKAFFEKEMSGEPLTQETVIEHLKLFAKYHVEQALKVASEKAVLTYGKRNIFGYGKIDKESILNSYPLDNIK